VTHLISGDAWGGAEALAFDLMQAQQRGNDVEPSCVLLNDGDLSRALARANVPTLIADEHAGSLPALAARTRTLIGTLAPDIIHAHRDKENLLAACARKATGNKPRARLLTTLHGMPEPFPGVRGLRRRAALMLDRTVCRYLFDAVICVSDNMRTRLGGRYGRPLQTVHNGISLPDVRPMPVEPTPGAPIRLIAAGRLVHIKRFERLAALASRLEAARPGAFHTVLAGEGPQRAALERAFTVAPAGTLQMAGFLPSPFEALAPVHGLLIVSDSEGMPMVGLEAAARGIPLFSFRMGGLPELFAAGLRGALTPSGDVDAMAEAILAHFQSHPERAPIPGPEWHFSIQQCAARYTSVYRRLLESAGG
jgi:glycosyltransferase involved in cell wall biosynthesis